MTDAGPRIAIALVCCCGLAVAVVAAPGGAGAAGVGWLDDIGSPDPGNTEFGDAGGGGMIDITEVIRLFCDVFDCSGGGGDGSRYEVAITPDPVPGRTVVATVTRDDRPVRGARVAFNGRYVGTTNASGQVSGRVPYEQELRVTVVPPVGNEGVDGSATAATGVGKAGRRVPVAGGPGSHTGLAGGGHRPLRAAAHSSSRQAARESASPAAKTEANVSRNYDLPGAATVELLGRRDPGATVTLVAAVEGVPMRNATVAIDGEQVGETGPDGRTRIRLPDDGRETITVRVERGAIGGETLVRLRVLGLDVQPTTVVALPGTSVVVNATVGGRPRGGVPISRDGERVARTGPNGTARVRIPWKGATRIQAAAIGQTATRHLRFLWLRLAGAVGVPLLLVLGVAAVALREGAAERVGAAATTVAAWVAALLVGGSARLGRFLRWIVAGAPAALHPIGALLAGILRGVSRRLRALGRSLAGVLRSVGSRVRRLGAHAIRRLSRVGAVLRHPVRWFRRQDPRRWPARLVAGARRFAPVWLSGLAVLAAAGALGAPLPPSASVLLWALAVTAAIAALVVVVTRRSSTESADAATVACAGPAGEVAGVEGRSPGTSVRALWRRFARTVRPADWQRRTPGEVARAAVDRGLPAGPVDALTTAFRDVEYGDRPADRVRDRARAAFDRLLGTG